MNNDRYIVCRNNNYNKYNEKLKYDLFEIKDIIEDKTLPFPTIYSRGFADIIVKVLNEIYNKGYSKGYLCAINDVEDTFELEDVERILEEDERRNE